MSWALVTTGPNRERIVAERLEKSGLTVRFFRMRRPILHKGKIREKLVPVYPRYLFTSITSKTSNVPQWRSIVENGAYFVRGSGGFPKEVSDALVAEQAARGIQDIFSDVEERSKFKVGDLVQLVGGYFMGKVGVFDRVTAPGWCFASFDIFGRSMPLKVKESDLVLISVKKKRRRRSGRAERRARNRAAA